MPNGDTLAAQVAEITQELITSVTMQMPQTAPAMDFFEKINIPKGKNSAELPRANATFSVDTPTEGDELVTAQQFDLTSTTISPTLRAIRTRISERAKYFSQEDLERLISTELARAQGQDIDTDITAEFTNLGQTAGQSNTDTTLAVWREARRKLAANTVANGGPAPGRIAAFVSPLVAENLLTNLGVQGVVSNTSPWIPSGFSEDLIRNYMVQGINIVGVPFFWDGYLTEDGSSDFICAMASEQAIQYVVSKDWDMRVFEESNWIGAIMRTVADFNSGVGKFANWGVKVTADGA